MRVFFYDGSFEGLLSAVFDAYTAKCFPDLLLRRGEVPPLTVTDTRQVATARDKADRVFAALEKKLSAFAFSGLLYAGLADDAASAMIVFRYIRKVFDSPRLVEDNLTDDDVLALTQLARKVGVEKNHLLGFARFEKTAEGIYFAVMSPRYDVLPLMLAHFRDRFADQRWVLYDAGRRYGIMFDGERCRELYMDSVHLRDNALDPALLAEDELLLQRLWKGYCSATAIMERNNPRLQARCMPRRFWNYLTEKR